MNFHYSLTGLPRDDVFDSYFMTSASWASPQTINVAPPLDPAGGLPSRRPPGSTSTLISKPATVHMTTRNEPMLQ